jgi:hypothetical protein
MLVRLAAIWYVQDQNEPSYPFCLELEATDQQSLLTALGDYAHADLIAFDPHGGYERNETEAKPEDDWGDFKVERPDDRYLFATVHHNDRKDLGLS